MELVSFVSLLLFMNIFTFTKGQLTCPQDCRCRPNTKSEYTVKCFAGGQTVLPSGLNINVFFLYVSGTTLTQNSITVLRKGYFQNTPNLFSLQISYSKVRTIENGAFSALRNLHDLVLSDNEIQTLGADIFQGLSHLRVLDISGNKACTFDKTIFTHISNIEVLNMGNMNLKRIAQDMFGALTKLKVLKLHMNKIKKIREDFIAPLPVLETLDLNGNLLRGVPSEWKTKFQTMKQVHFSENPLQCNCQLLWLRELPLKFYTSRIDTSSIVCNGPGKVQFASFSTVPAEDFVCIPPKVVSCVQTIYSVDLNDKMTISCEFEGDPIPEIKWTRPDGFEIDIVETVSNQYEINENGTLFIDGVTLADDGKWKVTAYNKTAQDSMDITVNVIVTTTSSSTTPSTTNHNHSPSTNMPWSSTKKSHLMTSLQPKKSTSALKPQTKPLSWTGRTEGTPRHVNPTETSVRDTVKTVIKESGVNWGLLIAAAAAGGTVVGIISIIIMCCKKKPQNDENQVEPFGMDDFK